MLIFQWQTYAKFSILTRNKASVTNTVIFLVSINASPIFANVIYKV